LLRVYWARALEYRGQMLVYILSGILPLIMMMVWLTIAEKGPVAGYEAQDFISYYLAVVFIRRMVGIWIIWDIDRDIRQGTLSAQLLRPLDPVHHYFAGRALANRPVQITLIGPPVALAAILLGARYDLSLDNLLLVALAIFGAILIEFFAQMIIGSLAFWITQSTSVAEGWFLVRSLLSGWIVPIDLFPPAVIEALQVLPFRYMLSFPIEILLGRLSLAEIGRGLAVQMAWAGVFWLGYRLLWQRGLRRYGAVGA
jgi:ABC-2 type transport system permease protein